MKDIAMLCDSETSQEKQIQKINILTVENKWKFMNLQ